MPNPTPKQQRDVHYLTNEFSYPTAGSPVSVFHSGVNSDTFSLSVHGNVALSVDEVLVKAFNTSTSDPTSTTDAVEATIDNGVFSVCDLIVPSLDPLISNVMSVRAWSSDNGNLTETFAVNNLLVTFTNEVTVSAKNCVWSHFAPSGLTGPEVLVNGVNINDPKENAWIFRPVVIPVPPAATGISRVTISVPTAGQWHNINPTDMYGPDGVNPQRLMRVRNEYLTHPQFDFPNQSDHANRINLGKLIAIFVREEEGETNLDGPTVEIGAGPTTITDLTIVDGTRANKILLGFHDKQEWYDNGGDQTVRVEFS